MSRSRTMKVHSEFYDWLKELHEKNGISMIQLSREMARDHKQLQFYLAEKKKKSNEPLFTLRI